VEPDVPRIVVAAFGNVLRSDDGFGVAVLARLAASDPPPEVVLRDVGIGGIHLVQDLLGEPADALVVLDTVELGRAPGTVVVIEPEVADVGAMSVMERRDQLADMHYATPDRALMLLRALDVLPPRTVVVGCEPLDLDTPSRTMTPVAAGAVGPAAAEVRRVVRAFGVAWPDRP
jgi:hydrogenase maturation protease